MSMVQAAGGSGVKIGDQHHAARRRGARAADHLHGGHADPADGPRRRGAAEGRGDRRSPPPPEQNQLVITVKSDGIYLNTQKIGDRRRRCATRSRAQMVVAPAAERVVFINSEDQIPFDVPCRRWMPRTKRARRRSAS